MFKDTYKHVFQGQGGLRARKNRKKSMHLNHRNVETWIQLWLHEIGIYNRGPLEFPIYIVEQTKCYLKLFLLKIFSLEKLLSSSCLYGDIKHKIKEILASVFTAERKTVRRTIISTQSSFKHISLVCTKIDPSSYFFYKLYNKGLMEGFPNENHNWHDIKFRIPLTTTRPMSDQFSITQPR